MVVLVAVAVTLEGEAGTATCSLRGGRYCADLVAGGVCRVGTGVSRRCFVGVGRVDSLRLRRPAVVVFAAAAVVMTGAAGRGKQSTGVVRQIEGMGESKYSMGAGPAALGLEGGGLLAVPVGPADLAAVCPGCSSLLPPSWPLLLPQKWCCIHEFEFLSPIRNGGWVEVAKGGREG